MPLDLAKFRNWARIPHTYDDPAIQLAYLSAVREMEERTGWCYDSVTRTQYVGVEPTNTEKLLLLSRQPVTAATTVDKNSATVTLTLVTINGLQYASLDEDDLEYPLVVTMTAGNGTINELLEMALLHRVTQHVASRGDDTQTLASDYWDRICPMMGKGIG
jgi:hypothetical protein